MLKANVMNLSLKKQISNIHSASQQTQKARLYALPLPSSDCELPLTQLTSKTQQMIPSHSFLTTAKHNFMGRD